MFLKDSCTTADEELSCVPAVMSFAESLHDKEKTLGDHIQLCTTD